MGPVYRLEPGDDARGVEALLKRADLPVAFDTEGAHLNVYAEDFELRLCQFGTTDEAYVWEPKDFPDLAKTVTTYRPLWMWNADYDTRVLDHCLGITLEETAPFVMDGAILSRLIDPRGEKDGGVGHSMDAQANERLGLDVKGKAKSAMMEAGKQYKLRSQAAVWAGIPTTDETYVRYAGQDVMLTSRLGPDLLEEIEEHGLEDIASFEHAVAYCVSTLIRKGWQIDRQYAADALQKFEEQFAELEADLSHRGVRPTATGNYSTSRAGLIERFQALGVRFKDQTASGAVKLDDEVLQKIADRDDEAAEIAKTVLAAKAAQKSQGFVRGFLEAADPNGRVHSNLNPLGTLTGRMSSSSPNLQNLTRDATEVRGCFVSEPGEVLIGVDFASVEWRVAAGVTGDKNMKYVFEQDGDMHGLVAQVVFGKEFTKAQRQQVKSVGLGRLYGGGVATLARQSGLPEEDVERAVQAIDRLYPGIREKVREAYDTISGPTRIELATGRHAITDAAYKALNVQCQGPARDLLAYGLVRLFEAGLGDNVLMLVHDEVILSVPEFEAEAYVAKVQEILACDFMGVRIESEGQVLGERWKKA